MAIQAQDVVKFCQFCERRFTVKRRGQRFCSDVCRARYHHDKAEAGEDGLRGNVASLTRLKRGGWSLTVHINDEAAAALQKGQAVKVKP